MLEPIAGQLWPYLLGIAALVSGFFYARQSGVKSEQNKASQQQAQARKEARNVEMETDGMADSDIDDDLAQWVRKPKR